MISVVGSGAFGTALAVSLAARHQVMLYTRDADHAADMRADRENRKRLPDVALPDTVTITSSLTNIPTGGPVLLAVPMQSLALFVSTLPPEIQAGTLIACCKGVDLKSGLGPVSLLSKLCPNATAAILTGPSFADDIACAKPTALTLACTDQYIGRHLQSELSTANLRLYRSADIVGAELGGALKNVMAIACGAVVGAGLGDSAHAALMTRGFAELQRYALHHGAEPETLMGLSGFGDLVLTCTSDMSRNYRHGFSIGQGQSGDTSITVEGVATAKAVAIKSKMLNIDMPVTNAVVALTEGRISLKDVIEDLLSRPLREE